MEMMYSDISVNSYEDVIPSGSVKLEDEFIQELKKYNEGSKINKFKKDEYRKRINKLYNDIGDVKPIDGDINNVIYFNDYAEVGIIVNKSDISLKQIWTEYRLLYNEKQKDIEDNKENSFVLDNFDVLFERISKKVDGIDKYIDDLNSIKKEIDADSLNIENSKANLEMEKIKFENYRHEEIARLEQKEKELNDKLEKLNKLVVLFENKIKSVY